MRPQARTPTTGCCTRREIDPVVVADEASRCAMEVAGGIKEERTKVMSTSILNPLEIGGVEAMRTGNGNPPRNASTVVRKATRRASAGRSTLIWRKPDPDKPKKEINSDRTTPKDPKKSERSQPS